MIEVVSRRGLTITSSASIGLKENTFADEFVLPNIEYSIQKLKSFYPIVSAWVLPVQSASNCRWRGREGVVPHLFLHEIRMLGKRSQFAQLGGMVPNRPIEGRYYAQRRELLRLQLGESVTLIYQMTDVEEKLAAEFSL